MYSPDSSVNRRLDPGFFNFINLYCSCVDCGFFNLINNLPSSSDDFFRYSLNTSGGFITYSLNRRFDDWSFSDLPGV